MHALSATLLYNFGTLINNGVFFVSLFGRRSFKYELWLRKFEAGKQRKYGNLKYIPFRRCQDRFALTNILRLAMGVIFIYLFRPLFIYLFIYFNTV